MHCTALSITFLSSWLYTTCLTIYMLDHSNNQFHLYILHTCYHTISSASLWNYSILLESFLYKYALISIFLCKVHMLSITSIPLPSFTVIMLSSIIIHFILFFSLLLYTTDSLISIHCNIPYSYMWSLYQRL